jgi:hypothetical protein
MQEQIVTGAGTSSVCIVSMATSVKDGSVHLAVISQGVD